MSRDARPAELLRVGVVAVVVSEEAGSSQRSSACSRLRATARVERLPEPAPTFTHIAAFEPKAPERSRQSYRCFVVSVGEGVVESGAKVVVLQFQHVEPLRLIRSEQHPWGRVFSQGEVERVVASPDLVFLASRCKALLRVGSDGLQSLEALAVGADEAVIDESREMVEVGPTTASAASSVKPPAKTAMRRNSSRSSSVRRS